MQKVWQSCVPPPPQGSWAASAPRPPTPGPGTQLAGVHRPPQSLPRPLSGIIVSLALLPRRADRGPYEAPFISGF